MLNNSINQKLPEKTIHDQCFRTKSKSCEINNFTHQFASIAITNWRERGLYIPWEIDVDSSGTPIRFIIPEEMN